MKENNARINTYPASATLASEVGDYTRYFWATAEINAVDGISIYVALGGFGYAPECGGFFPNDTLLDFDEFVQLWYAEEFNFQERLYESGFFNYMLSKQRATNVRQWDLAVAFVVAWLRWLSEDEGPDLSQDAELLPIIGAFYHNKPADAAPVLVRLNIIEEERD